MDALILKDVTKKYDGFTLDKVNLTVPQGVIMGFIGENGAGKSTTINLILDLIKRDQGQIFVFGKDNQDNFQSSKEHIGVVMDECCFPENLNAIHINRVLKNIFHTWNEKTFEAYIEKFQLPKKKIIKEYSKGMKMKISIAAALSHDSKLLILDEATSGLDPIVRDEILDILLEFIADENHSIFISSHIISDLEKICDYITFLHKGKVIFTHSKDDLLESFGILKCSHEQLAGIDPQNILGVRKNSFGAEALVYKKNMDRGMIIDRASIEDIMLFYIKEGAENEGLYL